MLKPKHLFPLVLLAFLACWLAVFVGMYWFNLPLNSFYTELVSGLIIQPIVLLVVLKSYDAMQARQEDRIKIKDDLASLKNRYSKTQFLDYKGVELAHEQVFLNSKNKALKTEFSGQAFHLDPLLKQHFLQIMSAHKQSKVFNGSTLRLLNMKEGTKQLTLHCQPSNYFNHLCTNLVMDYPLNEQLTVREIYEPGPRLSSFANSQMSNHMGLNVLVQSKDGYFVLQRKRKDTSISKGKLTASVGGAFELNACLSGEKLELTAGVQHEFEEELGFRFKGQLKFLGLGRQLEWGGKPQLYFYKKVHLTYAQMNASFKRVNQESVALEKIAPQKLIAFLKNEYKQMEPSCAANIIYFLQLNS